MKFTVSSTALFSRIQAISRVINSKNTFPILECFLIELKEGSLFITASDNETTLSTSVEVNEADGEGHIAISSKILLDALKEISEQPLVFNINEATYEVTVHYMNGRYNLVGQNADEYPEAQKLGADAVKLDVDIAVLLASINCTAFAIAEDEIHPVMNGIYVDITTEDITLAATDGHKLVRCRSLSAKGETKAAFILPKKPVNLLRNLLQKEEGDVQICIDSRNAMFISENYGMVCRLIEGKYPNYNSVIPKDNPNKTVVDRTALLSALRRVSVFSSPATCLVKLNLDSDLIKISAQDVDFSTSAEETVQCNYQGTPMSIGFRANFFIDILSSISSEAVVIELADPSRAGVILPEPQAENEDLLMLLMPMMLND